MLSMTQPLVSGTLADIGDAWTAFASAGVPPTALISTKRHRGGPLIALIAEWDPAATQEASDEPDEPSSTA